jgi:hypothetical protein
VAVDELVVEEEIEAAVVGEVCLYETKIPYAPTLLLRRL